VGALEHVLLGERPPEPFGPGYSRHAIARAAGLELPGQHATRMLASYEAQEAPIPGRRLS
jgi:hypothetical protein